MTPKTENLLWQQRCANAYIMAMHEPNHPIVKDSYDAFKRAIREQFNLLPVCVRFVDVDPYRDVGELTRDIDIFGRLAVYTPADLPSDHPMSEQPFNVMFRAVHDYFGHYGWRGAPKYNFHIGMERGDYGEDRAFRRHRDMMPKEAWMALACETRGQAAMNNLAMAPGTFGPQKACLLPAWVYED